VSEAGAPEGAAAVGPASAPPGTSGRLASGVPADQPAGPGRAQLARTIGWTDAFWIASGVPALLVFSIGYIAVLDGPVSALVWILSVLIGFGLAFVYAEMAGMFPDKSGGPPIFGAQAWKRYVPAVAPLNVWAYWFGWSAVQATGVLLMGRYIQHEWAAGQTWSLDWRPTSGLGLHIDFAYLVGAVILVGLVWLHRFGVRQSATAQRLLGIVSLVPLALMIVVPIFQGKVHPSRLDPFQVPGHPLWSWQSFELACAGLFVAGWSAYGFETAVAYTAEFRRPQRDVPRAIFAAGGLSFLFYGLGPFILYAVVGGSEIRGDPATALVPLANGVFGAAGGLLIGLLLVALLLSVNTAILGCARTLYQASKDGWTFGFLGRPSPRGVPMRAMGFAAAFNLVLMLLGDVNSILAAGAIGYLTFHTLNPVAGYLLRKDAPEAPRLYRAPTATVWLAVALAAANLVFVFVGAPSWGWKPVALGWLIVLAGVAIYELRRRSDRRGAAAAVSAGLVAGPAATGPPSDTASPPGRLDLLPPNLRWARLEPMIAYLLLAGAVCTLAAWSGRAWAYALGLALAAGWTVGFVIARNGRRRWFVW
jgi:amino acid transporter